MRNLHHGWSLEIEDWERLRNSLNDLDLDWKIAPLKNTRKDSIPNTPGVYLISGEPPFNLYQEYFNFRTPLYVGISQTNLRNRFLSHCKGELTGVRQIVRTWNAESLDFHYSSVAEPVDHRSLKVLIEDIETELMNAFGPSANIRSQILSYENDSEDSVEISYNNEDKENGEI